MPAGLVASGGSRAGRFGIPSLRVLVLFQRLRPQDLVTFSRAHLRRPPHWQFREGTQSGASARVPTYLQGVCCKHPLQGMPETSDGTGPERTFSPYIHIHMCAHAHTCTHTLTRTHAQAHAHTPFHWKEALAGLALVIADGLPACPSQLGSCGVPLVPADIGLPHPRGPVKVDYRPPHRQTRHVQRTLTSVRGCVLLCCWRGLVRPCNHPRGGPCAVAPCVTWVAGGCSPSGLFAGKERTHPLSTGPELR